MSEKFKKSQLLKAINESALKQKMLPPKEDKERSLDEPAAMRKRLSQMGVD